MDITPKTAALLALSQQSLKWETVLSELVDNSLDAGAHRVVVELGPGRTVRIVDDGSGCKDIAAMLTIGDHRAHETTKLGRYGIGLKDAALFLNGVTEIDTIHRGQRSRVEIDWRAIRESNRWIAPDPTIESTSSQPGTRISFSHFQRSLPQQDTQLEKLGFIFSPALLAGRQILIRSKNKSRTCTPYQLPEMTDVLVDSFTIEGRGVRLNVGIVKDGMKNRHPGFTRQHGHRTIDTSAIGAGKFSVSRIAGIVELDSHWALTKNKDDITELQDELSIAIFERCKGILEKADQQSQYAESAALNDAVSELMTEAVRDAASKRFREKRNQSPEHKQAGAVQPANSGRQRLRAEKVSGQDGLVARAARSGVMLDWNDSLDGLIGRADLAGSRVTLNSEIPLLQQLRRENQSGALAMIAFAVFVSKVNSEDSHHRRYLRHMEPADFMDTWSSVVAKMPDPTAKQKRRAS